MVLIATILGMIFEKKDRCQLAVTGCIGALVLVVSGIAHGKQAYKTDSRTIFIFGGTTAGKSTLKKMTGAGKLVADYVIGMLGQNSYRSCC